MNKEYSWDLSSLFATEEDFEKALSDFQNDLPSFGKYKGQLGKSVESLKEYIKFKEDMGSRGYNLFVYSKMKLDLNTKLSNSQDMKTRAENALSKFSQETAFDKPELMSLDENWLKEALDDPDLKEYKHSFDDMLRHKPHILSDELESLLAQADEFSGGAQNTFTLLTNADMVFEDAVDSNKKAHKLTNSTYGLLIQSKDRELRKSTFHNIYKTYKSHINTIASLMETEVKKNIFYARARGFNSAREAALFENNVPISVQDRLIDSIHANMATLHKAIDLRRKALGYEQFHLYDNYVPLSEYSEEIPYEQAKDTVLKAMEPMGEEYVNVMKKGFESRWIDVYPADGKNSGAYSWGTYDSPPYMLLNYNNTLNDVFTLAHEFGHSMHSYLSHKNQPRVSGNYSIFVAEVASTTNESLLNHYLMENETNIDKKELIITNFIDAFRGTVFRQGMFAEFERDIHAHVEAGGALTPDYLCDHYLELVKKYFGPSAVIDEDIKYEWSRIPHMYYNFYVYQYSTGLSAAIALSDDIIKNGPEQALKFLSAGSSDYPINVLKNSGIDMESGKTVDAALKVFEKLVNDYEKILERR